jgi:poly(A) polymerase
MNPITDPWLTSKKTQAVCAMLTQTGAQALFVGGCVRNAILGESVHDIDIATDAVPTAVIASAAKAKLKAIPTGIDHGTITVISGGTPYEITTFRRDVTTDGRKANVAFATDVAQDARRRDFTMNALYADPTGQVIDPLGGLADLIARRVRFIEDAQTRITEDYLRILRFFRFSAWYADPDLGFDPDALAAIAGELDGLDVLSRERVGSEMLKILAAPDPVAAVAVMRSLGVLTRVLAGADDRALGPLVHLETLAHTPPDAVLRLAALGGASPDTDLRLSKAQARRRQDLIAAASQTTSALELGYRHGAAFAVQAILLRCALLETVFDPDTAQTAEQGALAKFPLRATDLMPDVQGRALGQRLEVLENRWIASGFTLSRTELLDNNP